MSERQVTKVLPKIEDNLNYNELIEKHQSTLTLDERNGKNQPKINSTMTLDERNNQGQSGTMTLDERNNQGQSGTMTLDERNSYTSIPSKDENIDNKLKRALNEQAGTKTALNIKSENIKSQNNERMVTDEKQTSANNNAQEVEKEMNLNDEILNKQQLIRAQQTSNSKTIDLNKPFYTENHIYKIDVALNVSSGEANLYKAFDENQKLVLLKLYRMPINDNKRQAIVDLLRNLDENVHLMPILDIGHVGELTFDIIPYYEEGDLSSRGPIGEEIIKKSILPQLLKAIKYLHDHEFIHRDIKPENLFYESKNDEVILGDFGITSEITNGASMRQTQTGRGTEGYVAPEVNSHNVTFKSDYYSLGITLASLLKGEYIFKGKDQAQIFTIMFNQSYLNFIEDENLKRLIVGLTITDLSLRFSYKECIDYLQGREVPSRVVLQQSNFNKFKKSYNFEGIPCEDKASLSEALASNWQRAAEHLKRGLIDKFFESIDESFALRIKETIEQEKSIDIALSKTLIYFDTSYLLVYKDYKFTNITDFIELMLKSFPNKDPICSEIIDNRLLLEAFTYKCRGAEDKKSMQLLQFLQDMQNSNDTVLRYYIILFSLSVSKPSFDLNGFKIVNMDSFYHYLKESNNPIDALTNSLNNVILQAFLLVTNDHDTVVDIINRRKELSTDGLYDLALLMLNTQFDVLPLIHYGFQNWVISNYKKYKYDKEAKPIQEDLKLLSSMDLSTKENIVRYLKKRNEVVNTFLNNFKNDILSTGVKGSISIKQHKYYPVIEYKNMKVTYQYLTEIHVEDKDNFLVSLYKNRVNEIKLTTQEQFKEFNDSFTLFQNDYYAKQQLEDIYEINRVLKHIKFKMIYTFIFAVMIAIMLYIPFINKLVSKTEVLTVLLNYGTLMLVVSLAAMFFSVMTIIVIHKKTRVFKKYKMTINDALYQKQCCEKTTENLEKINFDVKHCKKYMKKSYVSNVSMNFSMVHYLVNGFQDICNKIRSKKTLSNKIIKFQEKIFIYSSSLSASIIWSTFFANLICYFVDSTQLQLKSLYLVLILAIVNLFLFMMCIHSKNKKNISSTTMRCYKILPILICSGVLYVLFTFVFNK